MATGTQAKATPLSKADKLEPAQAMELWLGLKKLQAKDKLCSLNYSAFKKGWWAEMGGITHAGWFKSPALAVRGLLKKIEEVKP